MSEGNGNPPDSSQMPPPGWVPPETLPHTPPAGQQWPPPGQGAGQQWPGQGYAYPPSQPPPTNGLAIAAFVLSIIGGILLSVIFGLIALRQIKRTGQRGRGLAIAALAISGVWVVLVIVVVAVTEADRDESGSITNSGELSVEDLEVGDCLNNLVEDEAVTTVDAVSCSASHEAEVYASIMVPDGDWPGIEGMSQQATNRCADDLAENFPKVYEDRTVEIFFFAPNSASWRFGDREITCVAQYTDGPRTGSLRD